MRSGECLSSTAKSSPNLNFTMTVLDLVYVGGRVPAESRVIEGVVNAGLEAVVSLTVQGPSGQSREIEAVIDTGFNDFLTVPSALAAELGLAYRNRGQMILADGSEVTFDIYRAALLWDGKPRHAYVYAADATPLVGMRMLDRHNLSIDVEDGGRVLIQAKE